MIKLRRYTEDLDVLTAREADDDAIDREFDAVCMKLFGVTSASIDQRVWDEIDAELPNDRDAITRCRALGYDPILSGNVPVPCVLGFAIILTAKSRGLVETDPERLLEIRLRDAADEFKEDREQ